MAIVKRKSVQGGTMKLKRLQNDTDLSNAQYKYVIEYPDGDRAGTWFNKRNAKREFDRRAEMRGGGSSGGGLRDRLGF